jgi:hypothetical protein
MILEALHVEPAEIERQTGWSIRPEGACRGDRCVPLPESTGTLVDVRAIASRLGMPLIYDEASGLWCLGPEGGGPVLRDAVAPGLVLPDVHGREFRLTSLRGRKVLLVAWASW